MKREFLRNLKAAEQPLPEDVIDLIMAEAGRDLENAKKPFEDYDTVKKQLEDAQKTIQRFQDQGTDLEAVRKSAREWEEKYNKVVSDHQKELDGIAFQHELDGAIAAAKGRNAKAITAMLDVENLRGCEDKPAAIKAALETLKKESGYLFEDEQTPPPYAGGTGTQVRTPATPATLADALRERFEK